MNDYQGHATMTVQTPPCDTRIATLRRAPHYVWTLLLIGWLTTGNSLAAGMDDLELNDYLTIEEILGEDTESGPAQPDAVGPQEEFIDLREILAPPTAAPADTVTPAELIEGDNAAATLEQNMEALKQQVLEVNRDLFILEEDLLFPASTQVNVFVSVDAGEYFTLDGINLLINDKAVQNHLYTEQEKGALQRGAVQRLYTGNLRTGEHEVVAVVTGIGPNEREMRRAVSLDFQKNPGTKYLELKIVGDTVRQQPQFQLREWD